MEVESEPDIKIFRLSTGEDVVGEIRYFINNDNNLHQQYDSIGYKKYTVINPMQIQFVERNNGRQTLALNTWVPLILVKHSVISLSEKDIITIIEPNDDFAKYYKDSVRQLIDLIANMKKSVPDSNTTSIDEITDDILNDIVTKIGIMSKGNYTKH